MEFHIIFSPILIIRIRILVHRHPPILVGLSHSPLFQYKQLQVSTCEKKLFAQSKVNNIGTRCNLLWHMHIIRNLFLLQLLNSNYKSIFQKCSLACSFALENLSTHMQTHILDASHFPFFSDFCNSITEFLERERERDPRPSVSLGRATQRDKFQDLKRMVHSTMLCWYSPSVIKEHKLLFQAIQCQKKQHQCIALPFLGCLC